MKYLDEIESIFNNDVNSLDTIFMKMENYKFINSFHKGKTDRNHWQTELEFETINEYTGCPDIKKNWSQISNLHYYIFDAAYLSNFDYFASNATTYQIRDFIKVVDEYTEIVENITKFTTNIEHILILVLKHKLEQALERNLIYWKYLEKEKNLKVKLPKSLVILQTKLDAVNYSSRTFDSFTKFVTLVKLKYIK
jgi:hypothetical protein